MQYFGGKAKIAKGLSQFMNSRIQPGQTYIEPFCGALNVASRISGPRPMYLSDAHPHLIAMWGQAFQDVRLFPDQVTEDDYRLWRSCSDPHNAVKGFVGFGCSFAGKWFGGYARGGGRNYAKSAINGIQKKLHSFGTNENNPVLACQGYEMVNQFLSNSRSALIYCDPPYRSTSGYSTGDFDSDQFNIWVRGLINAGHDVLVSEYLVNLPEGAIVVCRIESTQNIRNGAGISVSTTEILYTFPRDRTI